MTGPDVALFVPCYVDQLAPEVAWATLSVLERVGCRVHYDPTQTCCGQPWLNLGARDAARRMAKRHLDRFGEAEVVVSPSASCVATVRHRYADLDACGPLDERTERTYELSEFGNLRRSSARASPTAWPSSRAVTVCASSGSARRANGDPGPLQ